MEESLKEAWLKANQIRNQQPQGREKLLSWHVPKVKCISKGKSHFDCKVSVITLAYRSKGKRSTCFGENCTTWVTLMTAT